MQTLIISILILSVIIFILFITQNIMIVNKVEKKKAIISNKMKFFSNIYSAEAAMYAPMPKTDSIDFDNYYTLSTEFELESNLKVTSNNREIYRTFDKGQKVIVKIKRIQLLIPRLKKRFELFDDILAVKIDKSILNLRPF